MTRRQITVQLQCSTGASMYSEYLPHLQSIVYNWTKPSWDDSKLLLPKREIESRLGVVSFSSSFRKPSWSNSKHFLLQLNTPTMKNLLIFIEVMNDIFYCIILLVFRSLLWSSNCSPSPHFFLKISNRSRWQELNVFQQTQSKITIFAFCPALWWDNFISIKS